MSCIITSYIFLFPLLCAGNKYNTNYQTYEVTAFNHHERSLLYFKHVNNQEFIFLNGITNEAAIPMNVIVKNTSSQGFETYLEFHFIQYIHKNDISSSVQTIPQGKRNRESGKISKYLKTTFLLWHEFLKWVDEIIKMYSNLEKIIIGSTYENREIVVMKVSAGKRGASAVFIAGGEEGRDWMSPAIILNVLNELLDNKNNLSMLIKDYDFYFLPYFNPDGYEYSINKDILWNKNRNKKHPPKQCSTDESAIGVNIDRNWFLSNYDSYEQECRAVYAGNIALTEAETNAVSIFLNSIATNLIAYINLRGFERLITLPYGYKNLHSNNHQILVELLSSVCNKLKAEHNTTYFYGSTSSLFYNFSGNSPDWVKINLNVPIVYTVYMKYQDYLLPNASHIIPLTKNLVTILKDTLIFGYNIYGPLYNNQDFCQINFVTISLTIFHVINYI